MHRTATISSRKRSWEWTTTKTCWRSSSSSLMRFVSIKMMSSLPWPSSFKTTNRSTTTSCKRTKNYKNRSDRMTTYTKKSYSKLTKTSKVLAKESRDTKTKLTSWWLVYSAAWSYFKIFTSLSSPTSSWTTLAKCNRRASSLRSW